MKGLRELACNAIRAVELSVCIDSDELYSISATAIDVRIQGHKKALASIIKYLGCKPKVKLHRRGWFVLELEGVEITLT